MLQSKRWLCALAAVVSLANGRPAAAQAPLPTEPAAQVSADARRTFEASRDKLVQIRTLLRSSNTQTSAGSGFFVSADGLIISNFHVASQVALEPKRYRAVCVQVDGSQADLELLAFDVQHDLALLRVKGNVSTPSLEFRSAGAPLARGERIYSLGNPLDIGFAVTEGTFNGLAQRSFYPHIFFGGALNPGMSGGPALDTSGRVVGVNVSKRTDGELISFLVPGEFAQGLLQRSAIAKPMAQAAYPELTRQLTQHQALLVDRVMATPFKAQQHGPYTVPVPADALARCWGSGRNPSAAGFTLERTDCRLDSAVVGGEFSTGSIALRYEAYDAPKFGPWRFARMYSRSFANERFAVSGTRHLTAAECSERYLQATGMAMRAVVCFSAYRKLEGLYDVSVLVASVNQPTQGVQGRMDARGVSFDNGRALVAHFLAGFKWQEQP